MPEPEWLTKARAEGRIGSEVKVSVAPLNSAYVNLPVSERFASEAQFQQAVIELAHAHGAKVSHFRPVRVADRDGGFHYETPVAADGKGWPDLFIAIEDKRPIVAELKVGRNTPRPEQWEWIKLLRTCGIDVRVWYPSDWPEIVEALAHPVAVDERHAVQRMIDDGCPHAGD